MTTKFVEGQALTTQDGKELVITSVGRKENGAALYSYTLDGAEAERPVTSDVLSKMAGMAVGGNRHLMTVTDLTRIPALQAKMQAQLDVLAKKVAAVFEQFHYELDENAELVPVVDAEKFATIWTKRINEANERREDERRRKAAVKSSERITEAFNGLDENMKLKQLAALIAAQTGCSLDDAISLLEKNGNK